MPTHWLLFVHDMGHEETPYIDNYVAKLCEWLQEAFKEVQILSTSEVERQNQYYDRKANVISLKPGDFILAKANAYRGRSKVKDW